MCVSFDTLCSTAVTDVVVVWCASNFFIRCVLSPPIEQQPFIYVGHSGTSFLNALIFHHGGWTLEYGFKNQTLFVVAGPVNLINTC